MSNDISLSESKLPVGAATSFGAFYQDHAAAVGRAVVVAVGDRTAATQGLADALASSYRSAQRGHELIDPACRVFDEAVHIAREAPIAPYQLPVQDQDSTTLVALTAMSADERTALVRTVLIEDLSATQLPESRDLSKADDSSLPSAVKVLVRGNADALVPSIPTMVEIQRNHRRRSIRVRFAVAAAGLIGVAGAASLLPDRATPHVQPAPSTATSQDATGHQSPSAAPNPSQRLPEAASGAIPFDDVSDTGSLGATPDPEAASAPPIRRMIAASGAGDFVSIVHDDSSGIPTARFERSTDGRNWTLASSLTLGPAEFVHRFEVSDGRFVATLGSIDFSRSTNPVRIAISADLDNWAVRELHLDDPTLAKVTLRHEPTSVTLKGNDLLVVLATSVRLDSSVVASGAADDYCGHVITADGLFARFCDGADPPRLQPVLPPSEADLLPDELRLFLGPDGGDFEQAGLPPIAGSRVSVGTIEDRFVMADLSRGGLLWSEDGVDWTAYPGFDSAVASVHQVHNVAGEAIGIAVPTGGDAALFRIADDQTNVLPLGELIGELPERRHFDIAVGTAGLAMLIADRGSGSPTPAQLWSVERELWTVRRLQTSIEVRSTQSEQSYTYPLVSSDIRRSVFGGLRINRPGTDELLVDLARSDIAPGTPSTQLPRLDVHRRIDWTTNGWRLEGRPVTGPITLTSPAGDIQVYDDGYSFANGDTSDGVEIDVGRRHDLTTVKFYVDDTVVFEIETVDIFGTTVGQLLGDPRHVQLTRLLFSTDGEEWTDLAAFRGNGPVSPGLFVGDRHVMLQIGPDATMLIPIPVPVGTDQE